MSACFEAEGYGPGGTCPFCGARAETVAEEVAHMEARHPDVIEGRLREAGLLPDHLRRQAAEKAIAARIMEWGWAPSEEVARASARVILNDLREVPRG